MTKALTGQIINTRYGEMFIYNEQNERLSVGDIILVNGTIRKIQAIQPPSRPEGKWSVQLEP